MNLLLLQTGFDIVKNLTDIHKMRMESMTPAQRTVESTVFFETVIAPFARAIDKIHAIGEAIGSRDTRSRGRGRRKVTGR